MKNNSQIYFLKDYQTIPINGYCLREKIINKMFFLTKNHFINKKVQSLQTGLSFILFFYLRNNDNEIYSLIASHPLAFNAILVLARVTRCTPSLSCVMCPIIEKLGFPFILSKSSIAMVKSSS